MSCNRGTWNRMAASLGFWGHCLLCSLWVAVAMCKQTWVPSSIQKLTVRSPPTLSGLGGYASCLNDENNCSELYEVYSRSLRVVGGWESQDSDSELRQLSTADNKTLTVNLSDFDKHLEADIDLELKLSGSCISVVDSGNCDGAFMSGAAVYDTLTDVNSRLLSPVHLPFIICGPSIAPPLNPNTVLSSVSKYKTLSGRHPNHSLSTVSQKEFDLRGGSLLGPVVEPHITVTAPIPFRLSAFGSPPSLLFRLPAELVDYLFSNYEQGGTLKGQSSAGCSQTRQDKSRFGVCFRSENQIKFVDYLTLYKGAGLKYPVLDRDDHVYVRRFLSPGWNYTVEIEGQQFSEFNRVSLLMHQSQDKPCFGFWDTSAFRSGAPTRIENNSSNKQQKVTFE
eukprot:GHVQ01030541.1.p1 GENE.GHVQ01030541.1~~GHVQ01030541.1.p1  ORF type:complete len:393 (-),score=47.69 GHVQ01030541.1:98-1276(-)